MRNTIKLCVGAGYATTVKEFFQIQEYSDNNQDKFVEALEIRPKTFRTRPLVVHIIHNSAITPE
jgi:hypothetical protein